MRENNIGFIGCGLMGSAIIKGILNDGLITADSIWGYDISTKRTAELKEQFKINIAKNYSELLNNAAIIFLAVKPVDFKGLCAEIKPFCDKGHLIVSIAAGITTNYLETSLGSETRVVRLMPNMPCLVGEGVIAISPGSRVLKEDTDIVKNLLKGLGYSFEVAEKNMDAITAVSGSGPGYIYLFLEALIDAAVGLGLDRQTATTIALQTVSGSAKMAQITGKSMNELKNSITSPGGTTIAALKVMEEKALRGTVINAVNEAARRARELELN